jgi:hypothetical protein
MYVYGAVHGPPLFKSRKFSINKAKQSSAVQCNAKRETKNIKEKDRALHLDCFFSR